MAKTSGLATTGASDPVSIEKFPLEILERIFLFASEDDCDLSLALSSKSMAVRLKQHPSVRVLMGLLPGEQMRVVFVEYFQIDNAVACSIIFPFMDDAAGERVLNDRDVTRANWCTTAYVARIQIALIKRILRTYWDPLLLRDQHLPSVFSHEYVWAELDEFESNPKALQGEWLIESKVDASSGRYPWSRVYIWPKQGRVLIRDQLLNTSRLYCVPLLENMAGMKQESMNH